MDFSTKRVSCFFVREKQIINDGGYGTKLCKTLRLARKWSWWGQLTPWISMDCDTVAEYLFGGSCKALSDRTADICGVRNQTFFLRLRVPVRKINSLSCVIRLSEYCEHFDSICSAEWTGLMQTHIQSGEFTLSKQTSCFPGEQHNKQFH